MMRTLHLGWIVLFSLMASVAHAYDARWPDYGVVVADRGNAGIATYFQGFESPCFNPPYAPAPGELDWIRFYSEMTRVATGTGGIVSPGGRNHVEVRPPLAGAPFADSGAFTRLGGYRNAFGGGFTTAVDVYFDLTDPRVVSRINADYGWDATAGVNDQMGNFRRDFVFNTASNTNQRSDSDYIDSQHAVHSAPGHCDASPFRGGDERLVYLAMGVPRRWRWHACGGHQPQ